MQEQINELKYYNLILLPKDISEEIKQSYYYLKEINIKEIKNLYNYYTKVINWYIINIGLIKDIIKFRKMYAVDRTIIDLELEDFDK